MDSESKAHNSEPTSGAAMSDLLRHILDEYWKRGSEGEEQPQLMPAAFPDPLPVDVPLPDGIYIVGAVLWPGGTRTSLLFDSAQPREALARFYDERLLSSGWSKPDIAMPFGRGGFTNTFVEAQLGASYCMGEAGPSLQIRIYPRDAGTTAVNVSIETNPDASPCSPRQQRQQEMWRGRFPHEVLPDLRPPEGAYQFSGGGSGGGSDNVSSKALLTVDLPLDEVIRHYDTQLESTEWRYLDGGVSGPVAWSSWDFAADGRTWHALLTIVGQPWRPGTYRLSLQAETAEYGRRGILYMQDF